MTDIITIYSLAAVKGLILLVTPRKKNYKENVKMIKVKERIRIKKIDKD